MYGSTERYTTRIRSCPGPGSGTGASTVRKSLAEGYPVGLLANRICRWVEGITMAGA
jgi:hypothetical protein